MPAMPRLDAFALGPLLALGLLAAAGCNQNGSVSRLSGEGCQPACVRINTLADGDDDNSIECLDENLSSAACSGGLAGTPSCVQGTLTCMGGPVCVNDAGEMIGLPVCGL